MKALISIILIAIFLSCNSNKNTLSTILVDKTTTNCPEDGVCSFEVLKNKAFKIKKDEFDNSYSELLDGNKTVLKFVYQRNTLKEVQDGNYTETIYFEIANDTKSLNLKDNTLGQANIGFSRECFCRGQTGTYPVKSGNLNLSKTGKNTYHLNFTFKVSEVPQVITGINESFKL